MKHSLTLSFILLFFSINAIGQKSPLNFSTADKWPGIASPALTNDGKFVKYSIQVPNKGTTLFVQTTDFLWKTQLPGVFDGSFTCDSRRLVFPKAGDSLGILQLGTENISFIAHVADFTLPLEGNGRYLIYRKADSIQMLVLLDFATGQATEYPDTHEYHFDKYGRFLLLAIKLLKDSIPKDHVVLLDLMQNTAITLCQICQPSNFTFDEEGSKIAFFERKQSEHQGEVSLRYYKKGMDSAMVIANWRSPGMRGMQMRDDYLLFSKQGRRLFVTLSKTPSGWDGAGKLSNQNAQVSILGAHDTETKHEVAEGPFVATINLNEIAKGLITLQGEQKKDRNMLIDDSGEWAVTESNIEGSSMDIKRSINSRPDICLVSAVDGSRKLLKKRLVYDYKQFSPSGKFLIWFDRQQQQWFSYNIALSRTKNISASIKKPVFEENDQPDFAIVHDIAGWLQNGKGVLIYDRYDIWQVDLEGNWPPISVTHEFGAKNKVKFRYLDFHQDQPSVVGLDDTLLLSAFDDRSKKDGFYRLILKSGKLEKLVMSSHVYNYQHSDFCGIGSPGHVMKAKNSNIYLVPRMSATEYPNWYITDDFRDFRPLTDLAPQKEYNWYTTNLIHWNLPNGEPAEGILFKPENFDPKSKYPIIFYYYEKDAVNLNIFIHPALSDGTLPIPWFVSNGYLVFVPDIDYKIGHPGQSACNTVVSAALYFAKKPWVDSDRMGLQGHSFGGFETNYIASHSNLFAAAAPAAGLCDDLSFYSESDISPLYFERWQGRIGVTLWQRPDLYMENSPILNANKVSAAMLIMHGADDTHVPYAQGLQWYYALHRLGKQVWMLSYQGEGHILTQPKNQLDYSIRLQQFFDHYLKGATAPKWMTINVPSRSE